MNVPRTRRGFALAAAVALIAMAGLFTALAGSASAAGTTRYVATNGDDTDNDCTAQADPCRDVQYAVNQAVAGDTVSVAGGVYHEAVRIRKSLTLTGAGSIGSGRTTIDGPDECCDPSIFIDGTDTNTPPEVTIENVDVSGNEGDVGILIVGAIGHVNSSVVSNNDEDGVRLGQQRELEADDVQVDDAILPSATLSDDLIDGNGGSDVGAGVTVDEGQVAIDHSAINHNGNGGVVVQQGTAHVDTSTLDGNTGAALVLVNSGTVGSFTRSTASNTGPFADEGGGAFGAGLISFNGTLNVDTSTIADNVGQGVFSAAGYVHVNNSTISGTKPAVDGSPTAGVAVTDLTALRAQSVRTQQFTNRKDLKPTTPTFTPKAAVLPSTTLRGTIDADNTTGDDCFGPVVDGGYNLASDDSCSFDASGSIENGHAKLGTLADNGGPTRTLILHKGSDALDKIPSGSAGCDAAGTDQRGDPRLVNVTCDIGAVEVAQAPVVISPASLPHGTVGVAYHQVITATGGLGAPYVWSLGGGTLPPGLTFSSSGVISGTPTRAGTFHITVSVDDPTLKDYTIVIEEGAVSPAGEPPLANTGADVRPYAYAGAAAVGLGLLMLLTSGALGRWYRRYVRLH